MCGRDMRTLLGFVHPQALPEILGSKDFFQGSGGPALQIVGNKLVIHVKYEIRAITINVISFVPQADEGWDNLATNEHFSGSFAYLPALQDLTL